MTNSDIDSLFLPYLNVRVVEVWEMAGLVLTVAVCAIQSKLTEYYQRKVAEQEILNSEGTNADNGKLTGKLDGLTTDERRVVNDLLDEGNNVEIIPCSDTTKMPDYYC